MGENIKWLVILRKRGHIGEDDDGLQNSLVPFPWAILSFYEDRFEECFEKCCSACEFFFEDFSSDLWHFPSCISASSSKAEHHDLWVIRSHWSARDESGEPPDRELSSAVGHVAVMVLALHAAGPWSAGDCAAGADKQETILVGWCCFSSGRSFNSGGMLAVEGGVPGYR